MRTHHAPTPMPDLVPMEEAEAGGNRPAGQPIATTGRYPDPGLGTATNKHAAAAATTTTTAPARTADPTATTRQRTQTFDYVWRSFLAGGLAGCAAKTVVAPLDRVKILFQASNPQFARYSGSWLGVGTAMRDICRQDGAMGLFRGHSATMIRIFPYAAIKFVAYEQIRAVVIYDRQHETVLRRLLCGSLAGVTSVFVTYPLEVIRVRLAFETRAEVRPTLSSICRQIYRERAAAVLSSPVTNASAGAAPPVVATAAPLSSRGGLANFYRGFFPTVIGMLPYAGVSFLTHDTVGDLLRQPSIAGWTTLARRRDSPPDRPAPLRVWAELLAGGVAGMIAQTASYPLEVIRRRMQVSGAVGDGHRPRMAETVALILRERGGSGFFVGLTIGYVKQIPMVAVSFYAYERLKLWLAI